MKFIKAAQRTSLFFTFSSFFFFCFGKKTKQIFSFDLGISSFAPRGRGERSLSSFAVEESSNTLPLKEGICLESDVILIHCPHLCALKRKQAVSYISVCACSFSCQKLGDLHHPEQIKQNRVERNFPPDNLMVKLRWCISKQFLHQESQLIWKCTWGSLG